MPAATSTSNAPPTAALHWLQLAGEAWWMWAEASSVIAMRTAMIAFERPGHGREAERMVIEKLAAAFSLSQRLARAGPMAPEQVMQTMLAVYSPRVAANRRRLTRRLQRGHGRVRTAS
ncbi:hypothetical protein [Novosphingobium mangrovi (ex Hu et al. 2023)]|uniref:Uncharacterized protein n=1 Tax=Novosphingobium mangrovi (ex Hu et al. 2023) TaxID=2930094 RepID=A0ABT0AC48_9SPHN|nr:hypothetical protein [Novosphingobium mangrovi (ex Hu et al. 2023)]MCJ1960775.1 hypothetical protein [Novosphingobium mangrovi (ex Hu et al. 2023)]